MNPNTIRARMRKNVEECRDHRTGEVNYTLLAETTCNDLGGYVGEDESIIPETFFEVATEFE
jgi:hypothetical protein